MLTLCKNSSLIDLLSGGWYLLGLLMALAYALWEKIYPRNHLYLPVFRKNRG